MTGLNFMHVEFDIPDLKVVPGDNQREHWRARHRRVKEQRTLGWLYASKYITGQENTAIRSRGATLTFTRIAPKPLDEGDNLNSSCKGVRDGICKWLGMDDGPKSGLAFRYEQEQSSQKTYAVRVRIEVAT